MPMKNQVKILLLGHYGPVLNMCKTHSWSWVKNSRITRKRRTEEQNG